MAGNFTSSSAWKLMTNNRKGDYFGSPALTYIEERFHEWLIDGYLTGSVNAKPIKWGNFCEKYVYDTQDIDETYIIVSKDVLTHSDYDYWTGAPDIITRRKVGDIKCSWTRKAYIELALAMTSVEDLKKASPEFYWQLVSNSVLTGLDTAELIVFIPNKKDLTAIKERANRLEKGQTDMGFIGWALDGELPYLRDSSKLPNLTKFEFKVPEADKLALENRILMAKSVLNKRINEYENSK